MKGKNNHLATEVDPKIREVKENLFNNEESQARTFTNIQEDIDDSQTEIAEVQHFVLVLLERTQILEEELGVDPIDININEKM